MTLGAAFRERYGNTAPEPIDRGYRPFVGPQEAFDAAGEYEILFGGAKGPGKSHAALYKPLRHVHLPLFKALFLRVDFPSLRENIDRAHRIFPRLGATWNGDDKRYTFPSGATYEFGYAETLKDIRRYQGREPSTIVYDEIGQLADENVWTTMLAELRSPDPSIPRQAFATANPGGPGEPWLIRRFVKVCGEDGSRIYTDPSEPTMTRRFIPARVTDNPIYANDAKYMATLRSLPKRKRQQLLEGQWGIGEGRGLEELDERRHIIPAFNIPDHWTVWGAFDWGYAHPFSFGWFAQDEDGTVYLIDSIHGHRMLPWQQAAKIKERAPARARAMVWAGHDCWNETKARGENTPTIAQTFREYDVLLRKANISRVTGLNNMREYIKWQGPEGVEWKPRFYLFDTPGNRRTFEVLESMMIDPDDPEDVLKHDADGDTGENGDDPYDMVRYGLAAHPIKTRSPATLLDPTAVPAEYYQATAERDRKLTHRRQQRRQRPIDGNFGIF